MAVMQATRWDLKNHPKPDGEEIIKAFECRSEPIQVMKADADLFKEAISKAKVNEGELQEMKDWATRGLKQCKKYFINPQIPHFERILQVVELLSNPKPTGKDIIALFKCDVEPLQIQSADATIFGKVFPKAEVSPEELKVIGTWAALGLSHCAERGDAAQRSHFEKILNDLESRRSSPPPISTPDLSGWRL